MTIISLPVVLAQQQTDGKMTFSHQHFPLTTNEKVSSIHRNVPEQLEHLQFFYMGSLLDTFSRPNCMMAIN